VIVETGCGKSTQLPLYLHEAGWTQGERCVVCTQPRRVAATSVATRVAAEFGCTLGEEVGYGVRFDFKCSEKTRIKYYTDGVLLRETMSDPLLSKYSVIIVDEAHVRSLSSDILLGLLKKICRKRPDLRVVVTSATLDAQALKNFFETNENSDDPTADTACIVSVQGRQYPVDLLYLDAPCRDYIRAAVDTVLSINQREDWGDVLVFLPGGEEIDTAVRMLNEEYQGDTMYFLPLYAALPPHVQMAVFEPTPSNKRKVVLATNIAEASITIEGIRFVVDSGFVKLNYFDVRTGLEALVTCPITKAAAVQRAGRAGRTMEGKCFRLMTEDVYLSDVVAEHAPAEMQRTDITPAVLQLKALGIDDVLHFDFLSPPPAASMIYSLELLYSLGAVDDKCQLTPKGARMAEMPLEPRLCSVLLSSFDFGCGEEMLTVAAMCSVEYPFISVRARGSSEAKVKVEKDIEEFAVQHSDHLTLLNIYCKFEESGYSSSWCDSMSLQYRVLARAREIRKNLHSVLLRSAEPGTLISSCGDDDVTVRRCLVAGYFAHVARLGHDGLYHTLRGGGVSVVPHPTSVLAKFGAPPEWVIYNEVHLSRTTQLRDITKIDPKWLAELAPHYYNVKF
jgi:ATP-dependent RNA helicase DDX35